MNLNKVFVLGNLTRDPELRQTSTGQPVCSFGIATNSFYTDKSGQKQKKAEFHNIVVWGRQAEIANQFLKKGSLALIEGRIQTRTWQDREGQNRKVTEIVAERFQLGPRPGGSFTEQQPPTASPETSRETGDQELPEINIDEEQVKPEDIPF
jgi:single-strand DNA-binding protein